MAMGPDLATKSLVLYDGVCGFCNASIQFLLRRDPGDHFRFAPLQGPTAREVLARHGIDATDLDTVYVVEGCGTPQERVLSRSDAALHCAGFLGWPWKLGVAARVIPRFVRDAAYRLVAKYRYRIFGKSDACMIPTPDVRARFLDLAS